MLNKIIVVFPGQGSQIVGMGKGLFEEHHIARHVFEEVDNSLNFKLSKIIFEGSDEELTYTPNAQPALMAVSMALVRVTEHETKKRIFEFSDIILGHSLGEYSALCSLNTIDIKDAAILLRRRGEAMQSSVNNINTKMSAVIGLDISKVEKVIEENKLDVNEVCEIANDNCPGQVILSGTENGVKFISNILKKHGARSIVDLKVSAPFHCSLMKSASKIMKQSLSSVKFNKLNSKFISNVTANFEDNTETIKELLIKQVFCRVRWRESIIKSTSNINSLIEIGAGKILTGMNKRINKSFNLFNISNLEEIEIFLEKYKDIL